VSFGTQMPKRTDCGPEPRASVPPAENPLQSSQRGFALFKIRLEVTHVCSTATSTASSLASMMEKKFCFEFDPTGKSETSHEYLHRGPQDGTSARTLHHRKRQTDALNLKTDLLKQECVSQLAGSSCTEQVHGAGARSRCTEQVHGAGARSRCTEQLHGAAARSRCTEQLHGAAARSSCTEQLHGAAARSRCRANADTTMRKLLLEARGKAIKFSLSSWPSVRRTLLLWRRRAPPR
jgi:hypothetical protein